MTLIVLLILAAVSLSTVFSDKGVFSRAENAGEKYNEAKAREVLETVLLADGQYEKNINPDYNQDDFLDELIKSEIPGSDVKGDVAIIGEHAYELDRSVPKIGRYLGKAEDLIFPTVTATEPVLATDYRTASFTVTALEEKNGINKIEIWFNGEKIETLTKTYDNIKTEITENFTVNKNGKYTIKAYGNLMASITVEVTGIVPAVEFSPNGNETWEKEHTTVVTIQETADKVVKAKYVWKDSVTTPDDDEFTEEQTFKSGDTITQNGLTGTYYLWTMLETQSGEKLKWRSEGFNFDNEGPNITAFTATKYSETGITLSATAQDTKSGVLKFEFYVDDVLKGTEPLTVTNSSVTKSKIITGLTTGTHNCKVIIYDFAGNFNTRSIQGTTKLYTWTKWSADPTYVIKTQKTGTTTRVNAITDPATEYYTCYKNPVLDKDGKTIVFPTTGGTYYSPETYISRHTNNITWYDKSTYHYCTGGSKGGTAGAGNRYYVTLKFDVYSYWLEVEKYNKGDRSYGNVTSEFYNTYPDSGEKDGYWYVRVEAT